MGDNLNPPNGPTFNIETPSIATPGDDPRNWLLVQDIIPPQYPAGCEIWIMLPGALAPQVKIPVPVGFMIGLANPEMAEHYRAAIRNVQEEIRRRQEKQARAMGNRSR